MSKIFNCGTGAESTSYDIFAGEREEKPVENGGVEEPLSSVDRLRLQKNRLSEVVDRLASARFNQGVSPRLFKWVEDEILCVSVQLDSIIEGLK